MHRADALLIHEGELADVERLLEGMGRHLSQRSVDAAAPEGWERPPRLIVANGGSARCASRSDRRWKHRAS
jgi:hypothetical protein